MERESRAREQTATGHMSSAITSEGATSLVLLPPDLLVNFGLKRTGKQQRGRGGFLWEARGSRNFVRGVDLKGPKATGRVTGTQWGGGRGGGGLVHRTKGGDGRGGSTWRSTSEQGDYLTPCIGSRVNGWVSAGP
jgi:hypothetical protein